MGLNEYAATIAGEVAALREDAERWRWLVRNASLPVFDSNDKTITALVDRAREAVEPARAEE